MRAALLRAVIGVVALAGCERGSVGGGASTFDADTPPGEDGGTLPADSAVMPPPDMDAEPPPPPPPDDAGPPDAGPPPGPSTLAPGRTMQTVGSRQVLLYVPSSFAGGGPALIALHGNGDTASNFLATSDLQPLADAHGIALALPVAIPGSALMGTDWDAYTTPASANPDITLVASTITFLTDGGASPHAVYLLGYSQGGYLAFHAAMDLADRLGAVNVSSAADPLPGYGLARMAVRRIPVDLLIGDADFGIANARATRDELTSLGYDLRYTELPGVGHCCFHGERAEDIWSWLSARPLP